MSAHTLAGLACLALIALALPVAASDRGSAMQQIGDYVVHYQARSAVRINADLARRHGLTRAPGQAVITVAAIDRHSGAAVTADVQAHAMTGDGRMHRVHLREVRDADAILYLGELSIPQAGSVEFELQVRPGDEPAPHNIHFRRDFATH